MERLAQTQDLFRELRNAETVVIMPVFNDAESATMLLAEIVALRSRLGRLVTVWVDDGSSKPILAPQNSNLNCRLFVVRLRANLGHQRAIAVGLGLAANSVNDGSRIVVMDSDGEDQAEGILSLLAEAERRPEAIVVANRRDRREGWRFQLGYKVYKFLYAALTGHSIRYGNFSMLPANAAAAIAHMPTLWNHYAATIAKSRLPVIGVEIDRGSRYAGSSSMNFASLVVHGLSAISVHIEVVAARMLSLSGGITVAALLGVVGIFGLKVFSSLAIPGWASITALILALVAIQGIFMAAGLAFNVLAARDRMVVIPAFDSEKYIARIHSDEKSDV